MQELSLRPKLLSFRVVFFSSENRREGNGSTWALELKQDIHVGLAVPEVQGAAIHALVQVALYATARNEQAPQETAEFKAEYLATFSYPTDCTEAQISSLQDQEPHQYLLVAQAYPLAATHFRRELLATGFDARALPLGL